jgi:hypothetical protein
LDLDLDLDLVFYLDLDLDLLFPKLYGETHLTFKLHCQLHLVKQVKEFGPLHRYSSFPFEG